MRLYRCETIKGDIFSATSWTTDKNVAIQDYEKVKDTFFDDDDYCEGDSMKLVFAEIDEVWLSDEIEEGRETIKEAVCNIDEEDGELYAEIKETKKEESFYVGESLPNIHTLLEKLEFEKRIPDFNERQVAFDVIRDIYGLLIKSTSKA